MRLSRSSSASLTDAFLPAYDEFITQVFGRRFDANRCAGAIDEMHRHFITHGYDATMRSNEVWEVSRTRLTQLLKSLGDDSGVPTLSPTIGEIAEVTTWLRHWLVVLAGPIPQTSVVHTAMVGLCTLVAVAAKRAHGSRYISTEHGVYLREVYFAESKLPTDLLKLVRIRWARRITELSYQLADQISPCCDFNQRWELRNGADPAKLRTIYYGINDDLYSPRKREADASPVVTWVGRINPLKDLETLLKAAAIVCGERPDVTFNLYGSAAEEDRGYEALCTRLWSELHLQDHAVFKGYTNRPQDAFNDADIVVLPSISEGFPNSTLEAMMCGRAVVVTSVGGLPEQVAGAGIAVEPRNAGQLADAVCALLEDSDARTGLGLAARERARTRFNVDTLRVEHLNSYRRLSAGLAPISALGARKGERPFRIVTHGEASGPGGTTSALNRTIVLDDPSSALPNDIIFLGPDSRTLAKLADEAAVHQGEPVDALEVTALLETLGFNDDRARRQLGTVDLFEVGEYVFNELARRNRGREWWTRRPSASPAATPRDPQPRGVESRERHFRSTAAPAIWKIVSGAETPDGRSLVDHEVAVGSPLPRWRGLTTLLSSISVLFLLQLAKASAGWTTQQAIAVYAGVGIGMSLANGTVTAASRPLSFYLAAREPGLLQETLRRAAGWWTAIVALGSVAAAIVARTVMHQHRATLTLLVVGLVLSGFLWSIVGFSVLLGIGESVAGPMVAAAVSAIAVDRLLAHVASNHLAIATAVGACIALSTLRVIKRHTDSPETMTMALLTRRQLIAPAPTLIDALPYFVYGVLISWSLLALHALAWFADRRYGVALELGLAIGFVPLVANVGYASRSLHRFWRATPVIFSSAPADNPDEAGYRLERIVQVLRLTYLKMLSGAALIALLLFVGLVPTGLIGIHVHVRTAWFAASIVVGLVSGLVFGKAMFDSMFALSLGSPRAVVAAIASTVTFLVVIGWPIARFWPWAGALFAVLTSAVLFAALAHRGCRAAILRSPQLITYMS
jgi:glycosyltransferase involved in cell wall biosynthesis